MMNPSKKNSQRISFTLAQADLTRKLATEQSALVRETLAMIRELTTTLREWHNYVALIEKPVLVEAHKAKAKIIPYPAHLVQCRPETPKRDQ